VQLAFIQSIGPLEMVIVVFAAILVYGRRLPEVAGEAAGWVQRARRSLNDLKHETGLDEELRNARQTMDQVMNPTSLLKSPPVERADHVVGRKKAAEQLEREQDEAAADGTVTPGSGGLASGTDGLEPGTIRGIDGLENLAGVDPVDEPEDFSRGPDPEPGDPTPKPPSDSAG
jgi:Sec-independent protein translocase protein TatA